MIAIYSGTVQEMTAVKRNFGDTVPLGAFHASFSAENGLLSLKQGVSAKRIAKP